LEGEDKGKCEGNLIGSEEKSNGGKGILV